LLHVKEIDWEVPVSSELTKLIKEALFKRAIKIITHGDKWREAEVYRFQKTKEQKTPHKDVKRISVFTEKPPKPNDLEIGDWVSVVNRIRQITPDRKGIIRNLVYSPQKNPRTDGTVRNAWIATVEFPRLKRSKDASLSRVCYSVPLDVLVPADKPELTPSPLKMNPEAIRSRERRKMRPVRLAGRMGEIISQVTTGGL
jgi:hypothetical protein